MAEEAIIEVIRDHHPDHAIIGEETGQSGEHEVQWIIDPLDGTTNFLHGIPLFAVAIALQRGDEIVASVIYNPIMEELFVAEKGSGAWLDDKKRLRVAGRKHLADAVVCTGIKVTGTDNDALHLRQLGQIAPAVAGIRRTGSACSDLAWLAAGHVIHHLRILRERYLG